ncbi:MAG: HD domain-containing phosphohydrolase, partial [Endomicrobiia bacterium]
MLFLKLKFIFSYVLTALLVLIIALKTNFPLTFLIILTILISIIIGTINISKITKTYKNFYLLLEKISSGYLKFKKNLISFNSSENLNKSIKRLLNSFSSLIDISRMLSKETSLDKLLNLIIEQTTTLMDAERTTLFLYNTETKELWSYIAQELEIREIRLPIGKGIAGYCAQTGKILNIPDAYKDQRFDPTFDQLTGFKTRNVLCAPMFNNRGELLGVIQVLNKHNGNFNEYDESLLMAFSAQAGIAIENTKLYESQEELLRNFIKTIAAVVDARDPATKGHSERVARYSVSLARVMGLSDEEIKIIESAAILHDVGKISIPDEILKKPETFSKEEFEIIKNHAVYTREILNNIYSSTNLKQLPLIAASHHERLDGSGYPDGLKEKDISLYARIIGIADIYDALVSYDRPYKPAISKEEALKILKEQAEKNKLDKEIVDIFIKNKLYDIERREYVRISVELSIEYKILNPEEYKFELAVPTVAKDVSAGGLLFETRESIPIGSFLAIRINLHNLSFDLIATVVRKIKMRDKYQVGIKFINLSKDAKNRLAKYLSEIEETLPKTSQGGEKMELRLGIVDDFFSHVSVIALKLEDEVSVGDTIHVKGHTTDFTQTVDSMQIEHTPVQ